MRSFDARFPRKKPKQILEIIEIDFKTKTFHRYRRFFRKLLSCHSKCYIPQIHWNNTQTTIHPFVVYWVDEDSNLQFASFVLISESLEHNTECVHLFQKRLVAWLKQKFSVEGIENIFDFSDGASSQYENKKNFVNLVYHYEDFGIAAEWPSFATSHGKNACDGIGGIVKKFIKRESLRRPDEVPNASSRAVFDLVEHKFPTITFDFCSHKDHEIEEKLVSKRFDGLQTVNGTRSFHAYIPLGNNKAEV
ncbi:hypothetical protein QAD02_006788 [Eretmocerus hayati]|uniref:Uncharacterized protein n=1 Tax=Eretmocerus hayati TaxID=131215 RepID=A0ACC2N321_9HYME|nr:hypothetical protein QAD02_006788 [Eretmocerus hayati]